MFRLFHILTALLFVVTVSQGSETYKRIVDISVQIDSSASGKHFILSWNADVNAKYFIISRKMKSETKWTFLDSLPSPAAQYIDTTVPSDINALEYQIIKTTSDSSYEGYGYVYTGYDVEMSDYRGIALLVVDRTYREELKNELHRFVMDLTGDGYKAIVRYVERSEMFYPPAVSRTKQVIDKVIAEHPQDTITIILFGRIPVPYSGNTAWDGHQPDHTGAWPADLYYATDRDYWNDANVFNNAPSRNENKNIPFDGKFDQSVIVKSDIRIGRIDMFNLPDFKESELELLRKYLDKNHAFRHRLFQPGMGALLDDGFRLYNNEAFASNGWMAFSALLGTDKVDTLSYRYNLRNNNNYLWSYGCNSGAYDNIYNTAYTNEMAQYEYGSVFTMLLGSYAGDWDTRNNILRATIASSPSILAAMWAGRPFWFFHHMALGEPLGYSAMITQNNRDTYQATGKKARKGSHIELTGDPTLRMTYPAPPESFELIRDTIENGQRNIYLQWQEPDDKILGYNLYRADSIGGDFHKINKIPIKTNNYTDTNAPGNDLIYMLRSIKHEKAVTGSFYNMSQGVFVEVKDISSYKENEHTSTLSVFPNPARNKIYLKLPLPSNTQFTLRILDIQGKLIIPQRTEFTTSDKMIFEIDISKIKNKMPAGIYFITIQAKTNIYFGKLIILN